MKNILRLCLFTLFVSTSTVYSSEKNINKAVRVIANTISEDSSFEKKTVVIPHLLTLDNRNTVLGKLLSQKLINRFTKTKKMIPIERDFIFKLAEEMKLSYTGLIDKETIQQVGHVFGAEYLMVGTLQELDRVITIHVRLVRTETAEIEKTVDTQIKATEDILNLLHQEMDVEESNPSNLTQMNESEEKREISDAELIEEATQAAAPLIFNQEYYKKNYNHLWKARLTQTSSRKQSKPDDNSWYERRLMDLKRVGEMSQKEAERRNREKLRLMELETLKEIEKIKARERERQRLRNIYSKKVIVLRPKKHHKHKVNVVYGQRSN